MKEEFIGEASSEARDRVGISNSIKFRTGLDVLRWVPTRCSDVRAGSGALDLISIITRTALLFGKSGI